MQDEELDKIVQEAANQHHPPYDDSAWDKMEQLLDKHLPQQKDRKRPAFLLLLLLLLCGGTLFYTLVYPGLNSNKQPDNTAIVKNEATKNNDQSKTGNTNNINNDAPVVVKDNANITSDNDNTALSPNNTGNNSGSNTTQSNDGQITNGTKNPQPISSSVAKNNGEENLVSPASPIAINKKARVKMRISNGSLANDEMQLNNASTKGKNKKQDVAKNKKKQPNNNEENNFEEALATVTTTPPSNKININPVTDNPSTATAKTTVAEETNKEKKKDADSIATAKREEKRKADTLATAKTSTKKEQKEKKGFASNFGITVSAGTDLSYVDAGHLGKATFLYGGGLSYAINKRLLVRTGFYVSKKIYSASPDQYNGVIYPYLTKVDGDCKVYEIPLSVNYNFGAKKNHNWFGSVGMSSFLMKKEEYLYTYKVPGGSTYYYDQTVNNENKHFFSVLNLSAGYQYNASERVSFMAEPFVKLPLAGVGAGKIKLNSAGILLTATVRPFAKKKK